MRNVLSALAFGLVAFGAEVATAAEETAQGTVAPAAIDGTQGDKQAPPAEDAAASADDGDKVVCKRPKRETGSNLRPEKECRTKREWDEIAAESRRALEDAQQKN